MKLKVNNTLLDPIRVGNRLEFRFNAPEDLQYVTIEKDDFMGDLELSEIQLEQSTIATNFVEPMESETVASGIFKSVQGISYEITNPNSDTWAEIIKTSEASIQTYHNGTLQSTLAQTAEDVLFGVRDIVSGDLTSFNLRLDGIETSVKNEMYYSVRTQLADFIGFEISDLEGNVNTIQNTVDRTVQRIEDTEGNVNTLQSTVDGTIQRIEDTEGNVNTLQSTADANAQSITDLEGNYNNIVDTVNYHSQTIGSDGGNLAQKVMSDELFQLNLTDEIETTSYTQMADMIGLRVGDDSHITIGGDNIMIASESIYLNDSTQIKDGIITNNLLAEGISADKITTGEFDAAQAHIINLDADSITGNEANFISAMFSGTDSDLRITSDSVGMMRTSGGYAFELRENEARFGLPVSIYQNLDMRGNNIIFGTRIEVSANALPGNWLDIKYSGAVNPSYRLSKDLFEIRADVVMHGHQLTLASGQSIGGSGGSLNFGVAGTLRMQLTTTTLHLYEVLEMNDHISIGNNRIQMGPNAYIRSPGDGQFSVVTGQETRILVGTNNILLYRNTSLEGYNLNGVGTINYQSDERLKRDIRGTELNSLNILKSWRFVGYNWKNRELNADNGRQMGLIAQDTPYVATYDSKNDIWGINGNKLNMVTAHAVQQLAYAHDYINDLARSNEDKIHELQSELSKANRRIEELRGMIA